MIDTPAKCTILDFDERTITTFNHALKLWGVRKMEEPEKRAATGDLPPMPFEALHGGGEQKEVAGFMAGRGGKIDFYRTSDSGRRTDDEGAGGSRDMGVGPTCPGSVKCKILQKTCGRFSVERTCAGNVAGHADRQGTAAAVVAGFAGRPDSRRDPRQIAVHSLQIGPMPPMNPERAQRVQQQIDNLVKASQSGAALFELTDGCRAVFQPPRCRTPCSLFPRVTTKWLGETFTVGSVTSLTRCSKPPSIRRYGYPGAAPLIVELFPICGFTGTYPPGCTPGGICITICDSAREPRLARRPHIRERQERLRRSS